jgi:hypothetical protein
MYINDILLVNADKLVFVINVADKLFTCHETTINISIYTISLTVIYASFCLGVVRDYIEWVHGYTVRYTGTRQVCVHLWWATSCLVRARIIFINIDYSFRAVGINTLIIMLFLQIWIFRNSQWDQQHIYLHYIPSSHCHCVAKYTLRNENLTEATYH